MEECCGNCRFWREPKYSYGITFGRECRRNSPVIVDLPPHLQSEPDCEFHMSKERLEFIREATRWPIVANDEWCGEWEKEANA
jgi:hypothetical protein